MLPIPFRLLYHTLLDFDTPAETDHDLLRRQYLNRVYELANHALTAETMHIRLRRSDTRRQFLIMVDPDSSSADALCAVELPQEFG